MKNLKIVESCLVNGNHCESGTTLKNVDNHVAAELLVNGRAVIMTNSDEAIAHRDPITVENRDPKPSRTARKAASIE